MAVRAKKKRRWPWWLGGREERCAGCDHRHSHGSTIHCVACDRGFCPLCIAVVDGEAFCVECHDAGGVG